MKWLSAARMSLNGVPMSGIALMKGACRVLKLPVAEQSGRTRRSICTGIGSLSPSLGPTAESVYACVCTCVYVGAASWLSDTDQIRNPIGRQAPVWPIIEITSRGICERSMIDRSTRSTSRSSKPSRALGQSLRLVPQRLLLRIIA